MKMIILIAGLEKVLGQTTILERLCLKGGREVLINPESSVNNGEIFVIIRPHSRLCRQKLFRSKGLPETEQIQHICVTESETVQCACLPSRLYLLYYIEHLPH